MARSYAPPRVARRVPVAALGFDTLASDVGPATT
jgi:hypothetical protein